MEDFEKFDETDFKKLSQEDLFQLILHKNEVIKKLTINFQSLEYGEEYKYKLLQRFQNDEKKLRDVIYQDRRIVKKIYRNCFNFLKYMPKKKRVKAIKRLRAVKGYLKELMG